MWSVALEHIRTNPFFGVGPMHYACGSQPGLLAHPHNALFQVASEWGVPAALIIVCVLGYAALRWMRLKFSEENLPIKIALTASIATAGTHALFSGVIIMPLSQMTMALVAGWALSYALQNESKSKITASAIVFSVLAIIAAGIMIWPMTQAPKQPEALNAWHEAHPDQKTHKPRLWV